jgi:SAM-dependent methyltransferase
MYDHDDYFARQLVDNDEFFRRFGKEPTYAGKSVLDLACGHGALSVRAAQRGAASVVGIDLNCELIEFGRRKLAGTYPELVSRVDFRCGALASIESTFDVILAKDAFEHIADVAGTLDSLRERLEPSGSIWIGSSPLYFSPKGDHGLTGIAVPWAHTLPWSVVRRFASRHKHRRIGTLEDLGLNGVTPAQFRSAIGRAGLRIESILYNRGEKPLLRALTMLRQLPGLEKYATVSVYAILIDL